MIVCVDLHETITTAPDLFRELLHAWRMGGIEVHILTGEPAASAEQAMLDKDVKVLADLGLADCYDKLVVVANPKNDVADLKVAYMRHVGAAVLVDNLKANCEAVRKAGMTALRFGGPRGQA